MVFAFHVTDFTLVLLFTAYDSCGYATLRVSHLTLALFFLRYPECVLKSLGV